MNYLDANFIYPLFFPNAQAPTVEKYVRKSVFPLVVSPLAELECRRAFVADAGNDSEQWRRLQQNLQTGFWLRLTFPWEKTAAKAAELVDKFGSLRCGTLDTLHVACAVVSGASVFCSFDTNSKARVLANCARLKIFPELTAQEKSVASRYTR